MSKADDFYQAYKEFTAELPEWIRGFIISDSPWSTVVNNSLQTLAVAVIGWTIATLLERMHTKYMTDRENLLADINVSTNKNAGDDAESGILIYGSVVVAHDFFRTLVIQFRKIIGGNIKAYERLVARGRREAFIRMREDARLRGVDSVINVRFTGNHVSGRFLSAVEMVAYGTGIKTRN